MGGSWRNERGQVAVGLLGGLALIGVLTAIVLVALASAVPLAWQESAAERARARRQIIGTGTGLKPDWGRVREALGAPFYAGSGSGNASGGGSHAR